MQTLVIESYERETRKSVATYSFIHNQKEGETQGLKPPLNGFSGLATNVNKSWNEEHIKVQFLLPELLL